LDNSDKNENKLKKNKPVKGKKASAVNENMASTSSALLKNKQKREK
jgi:hypothetical protein